MKKMILSILIGLSSFALFAVEYEQICKLPEGCRLDSYGNCPDCVLVPAEFVKPLPKDIYNGKVYLKPGKYEITKATNNEGFHSFWDSGVYLDIYTIGEEIYLVNITKGGFHSGVVDGISNCGSFWFWGREAAALFCWSRRSRSDR